MDDREADVHNFSTSPSQHRLPTVTGIQALQNATAKAKGLPSGISGLDTVLASEVGHQFLLATPGIQRGHVTEVFGPPGVGKTTFGLQVAVNLMCSDQEDCDVLWVNTGFPLIDTRLEEMMGAYSPPSNADLPSSPPKAKETISVVDARFTYLDAHTLPRLLTVFLHPQPLLPAPNTSLIVVDDLSNLLLGALARPPKDTSLSIPAIVLKRREKQAMSRRFQIIENLATAMSKMAAIRNIAILVLTNSTMTWKSSGRAILKPGLSSQAWESAVHTRIMLYRDFPSQDQLAQMPHSNSGLRLAEVQRLARKEVFTQAIPFMVTEDGMRELVADSATSQDQNYSQPTPAADIYQTCTNDDLPLLPAELSQPEHEQSPTQGRKRKVFEVADSEDEEDEAALSQSQSQSNEPKLPSINWVSFGKDDEMILETHETALLRRERHVQLRGSEDDLPAPMSDSGEKSVGTP